MTTITTSEIKILAIQVILMALLTGFMALYAIFPGITSTPQTTSTAANTSVDASGSSWITEILSIPDGMETMLLISVLVISPFLFFDAMIAIRFIKDISTQWV